MKGWGTLFHTWHILIGLMCVAFRMLFSFFSDGEVFILFLLINLSNQFSLVPSKFYRRILSPPKND